LAKLGVKTKEDSTYLYFDYDYKGYGWSLIYNKDKDSCLLLRNGKPAILKDLTSDEEGAYKDVLDFAIEYHHEKGDAELH